MIKNKFTYGAAFSALMMLVAVNPAFAQSLTTVDPGTITTPVIARPDPSDLTVPFTPEAPPVETEETTGTDTPDPRETQETQETEETVATQETEETIEDLNLPDPELPVLDLGLEDPVDDEGNGILIGTSSDYAACITPEDAEAKILPPVIGNQIKVALIALLGAIMGATLWVLGSGLIASARGRGEILRIMADGQRAFYDKKTVALQDTKEALGNALHDILVKSGNKTSVNPGAFDLYCRSSADLEIFGSDESLEAHKKMTALLSSGNPSPEDIAAAKSTLLESLQMDIFNQTPHGPADMPRHD